MANRITAAAGAWGAAATWQGGVKPVAGDDVTLTHFVYQNEAVPALGSLTIDLSQDPEDDYGYVKLGISPEFGDFVVTGAVTINGCDYIDNAAINCDGGAVVRFGDLIDPIGITLAINNSGIVELHLGAWTGPFLTLSIVSGPVGLDLHMPNGLNIARNMRVTLNQWLAAINTLRIFAPLLRVQDGGYLNLSQARVDLSNVNRLDFAGNGKVRAGMTGDIVLVGNFVKENLPQGGGSLSPDDLSAIIAGVWSAPVRVLTASGGTAPPIEEQGMSIVFQRTVKIGGVDANADSMPTIRIVRLDTGAEVVATTSDGILNPSPGIYAYTLEDVAEGVVYESVWTFIIGGRTVTAAHQSSTVGAQAVGRWCNQSDIESEFGVENVRVWSNLENISGATDKIRVHEAMNWAEGRINDAFASSRFTVPLVPGVSGLATIKSWQAKLAGVWLFRSRGKSDEDTEGKYGGVEKNVMAEVRQYVSGVIMLDAQLRWAGNSPTGPGIV